VLAPPLPVPGFAIHMAWHDRNHRDAAQRWVRDKLVAFARESGIPLRQESSRPGKVTRRQ